MRSTHHRPGGAIRPEKHHGARGGEPTKIKVEFGSPEPRPAWKRTSRRRGGNRAPRECMEPARRGDPRSGSNSIVEAAAAKDPPSARAPQDARRGRPAAHALPRSCSRYSRQALAELFLNTNVPSRGGRRRLCLPSLGRVSSRASGSHRRARAHRRRRIHERRPPPGRSQMSTA